MHPVGRTALQAPGLWRVTPLMGDPVDRSDMVRCSFGLLEGADEGEGRIQVQLTPIGE